MQIIVKLINPLIYENINKGFPMIKNQLQTNRVFGEEFFLVEEGKEITVI